MLAVEIDPRLAAALPGTVALARAGVGRSARRHRTPTRCASRPPTCRRLPTALVANLPYNVAVPVLLHALATFPPIARALVMVQAEVAERLAAPPGSRVYGVPSVKARWYAEVSRAGSVGAAVFWPAPRVESGLVLLRRREPPAVDGVAVDRAETFAVIDAAFAQRRKMLRAALAGWAGSAEAAVAALHRGRRGPDRARRSRSTSPTSPASPPPNRDAEFRALGWRPGVGPPFA